LHIMHGNTKVFSETVFFSYFLCLVNIFIGLFSCFCLFMAYFWG
jgi:hypothetical protein